MVIFSHKDTGRFNKNPVHLNADFLKNKKLTEGRIL